MILEMLELFEVSSTLQQRQWQGCHVVSCHWGLQSYKLALSSTVGVDPHAGALVLLCATANSAG